MDKGKYRKWSIQRKWTDCEYHFQDSKYVSHTSLEMSCATTKFLVFPFYWPHMKHHGVRWLIKHYNIRLGTKLGRRKFAIRRTPCKYVAFTNILDKIWVLDVDHAPKPRYQPVVDYTYWPMLGYFNAWNIIRCTNKDTSSGEFDEVHKVVLDVISANMS